MRLVVIVGSILALFWFLFLRGGTPDAIAGNKIEDFDTFAAESQAGQLHTTEDVQYASTPPVSGQHDPQPGSCGVNDAQIPDENMVHNLEHGAVGVLYRPDAPIEDIREIERLVGDYDSHVFSEPYPDMETPYAVVAWAHLMRLKELEPNAITEFIDVFREGGDSPEEQPCPMDADDPFQPENVSPTPTVSPAGSGAEQGSDGGRGDGGKGKGGEGNG